MSTLQHSQKRDINKQKKNLNRELRVFADFHNTDTKGRLRLNCIGTTTDLNRLKIKLWDGQPLTLYSEDLEVDGIVKYSEEENIWVAVIDWDNIRQVEYISKLIKI
jgi:hypothetical protein